jgi:hypothetical protein
MVFKTFYVYNIYISLFLSTNIGVSNLISLRKKRDFVYISKIKSRYTPFPSQVAGIDRPEGFNYWPIPMPRHVKRVAGMQPQTQILTRARLLVPCRFRINVYLRTQIR